MFFHDLERWTSRFWFINFHCSLPTPKNVSCPWKLPPQQKKRGYLFFLGKLLVIWRHSHLIQNEIVAIRQINGALLKLRKTDVFVQSVDTKWWELSELVFFCKRSRVRPSYRFLGRNRRNVDLFCSKSDFKFPEISWRSSHECTIISRLWPGLSTQLNTTSTKIWLTRVRFNNPVSCSTWFGGCKFQVFHTYHIYINIIYYINISNLHEFHHHHHHHLAIWSHMVSRRKSLRRPGVAATHCGAFRSLV